MQNACSAEERLAEDSEKVLKDMFAVINTALDNFKHNVHKYPTHGLVDCPGVILGDLLLGEGHHISTPSDALWDAVFCQLSEEFGPGPKSVS